MDILSQYLYPVNLCAGYSRDRFYGCFGVDDPGTKANRHLNLIRGRRDFFGCFFGTTEYYKGCYEEYLLHINKLRDTAICLQGSGTVGSVNPVGKCCSESNCPQFVECQGDFVSFPGLCIA